jgi:molybdopterin/thiamine biosynthesis adenylyltransferase
MSTLKPEQVRKLSESTVLMVGVGGLGCAAGWALARAGVGRIYLADDDAVDESNLHRQLLYDEADIGDAKVAVAAARLAELGGGQVVLEAAPRLVPDNVRSWVRQASVVVEGADNYASKFMLADAARIEGRPIVHGAAIGFRGTAWAVAADGRPCYRCLFEDIPQGVAQNCSSAGVMGPVVGFVGALMADLALGVCLGEPRFGQVIEYDGKRDRVREVRVPPRNSCPTCGEQRAIFDVEEQRYTGKVCAA